MTWVDGAAGWGWWVGFLIPLAVGMLIGWAARVWVEQEKRRAYLEWAEAQRAARVYQDAVDRAKSKHPAFRERT